MKSIIRYLKLAGLLFIFVSLKTSGQGWTWQWAESITSQTSNAGLELLNCDFYNNLYCLSAYDTILFLPDTTFYHPEQYPGTYCCNAIAKYNSRGEFQKAVDFYTLPFCMLAYTKAATDLEMNLYISTTFSQRLFIQDTIINHCYTPVPESPDGLLMKLSPEFELIWAKLIGGYYQDDIWQSIVTGNGDIYVSSHHYCDIGNQVIFFGQDTVFSDEQFSSISKLDKNGNLLWRKDFYGNIEGYHFEEGKDGLFYWWGSSSTSIILDSDTTFFPSSWPYYSCPFYVVLNQAGEAEEISFLDLGGVTISEMVVNNLGEKYVGGIIFDTLFIFGDTIIIPGDTYYRFIGKYNQTFEPVWYHIIPRTTPNQLLGIINLDLDDDNLIFSISTDDDLQIADTIMPIYYGYEAFIGEFGPDGDLNYILRTETNNSIYAYSLILDNCNNPVISGSFKGVSYLGIDTLDSYSNTVNDGYIAKLQRNEPYFVDLGMDTLACAEYIIQAPSEYAYFVWNDSLTLSSWLNVVESGTYTLACGDISGCWAYDTININIHPAIEIDLGPDTTILENDAIVFTVPDGYESYLWSNFVTTNSITIFGGSYDPGTIIHVWVQVTDGPCMVSDTVLVTIKSEFALEDYVSGNLFYYPNPFTDYLYIKADSQIRQIEICDLNGLTLLIKDFPNAKDSIISINLEDLTRGVYILRLGYRESEVVKKIVKL